MHTGRFNREIRVKTRRRRHGWTDQGRKVNMRVVSMWGKSIKGISAEWMMDRVWWKEGERDLINQVNPSPRSVAVSVEMQGAQTARINQRTCRKRVSSTQLCSGIIRCSPLRTSTITVPGWTTASGGETTATSSCFCCRWQLTWSAFSPSASYTSCTTRTNCGSCTAPSRILSHTTAVWV